MPATITNHPITTYAYDALFHLRVVVVACLRRLTHTCSAYTPFTVYHYVYDDSHQTRSCNTTTTVYDDTALKLNQASNYTYDVVPYNTRQHTTPSPQYRYDDRHPSTTLATTPTDYDTAPHNNPNSNYDGLTPNHTFVYGTYIDEPIAKIEGGSPIYYHCNRKYDVAGLTDATGTIVELYAYTPYGTQTVLDASGTDIGLTAQNNPYGFTGRRYDEETGLWYFRARYFDSELGRFISRDPLSYIDGMSLYTGYFAAKMWLDPNGTDFIAVGTRPAGGLGWIPYPGVGGAANHLSLEFYECPGKAYNPPEGYEFTSERPPYCCPTGSSERSDAVELLNRKNIVGYWDPVPLPGGVTGHKWKWASVSEINRSSTATRFKVIYSQNDAAAKWATIIRKATTYPYAEQAPISAPLQNWPNSKYGYGHGHLGPYNNSNTFVRVMAATIGRNADVIGGSHPGRNWPTPVPHPGYDPIAPPTLVP